MKARIIHIQVRYEDKHEPTGFGEFDYIAIRLPEIGYQIEEVDDEDHELLRPRWTDMYSTISETDIGEF